MRQRGVAEPAARVRQRPHATGLLLAFWLLGCGGDLTVPETTIWEATLLGSPAHPSIQGMAAAISRPHGSEAGIEASGLAAGGTYTWAIRRGSCEEPGEAVGPSEGYPQLTAGEAGTASVETVVGNRLVGGNTYHVEMRPTTTEERVACGDFDQR